MKLWFKRLRNRYKHQRQEKLCGQLKRQIAAALKSCTDKIPVLIICYNNGTYVKNMVRQMNAFGITPIVIDNDSKDPVTSSILKEIQEEKTAYIAFSPKNFGHMVGFLDAIYIDLPEVFAYTDPDLQLNPALPPDFLSVLAELTETFSIYKAGFALTLLDDTPIISNQVKRIKNKPMIYERTFSVTEWESQFWRKRLVHDQLEIYAAPIDTTFAVYRKANYLGTFLDAIRVAGDYSALHLPWYPEIDICSQQERSAYKDGNISSTWT